MASLYRWRKGNRCYCATMETDLLGDLIVTQAWSSTTSQVGNMKVTPVVSEAAGVALLQRIARRRAQRRYALLN